MADRELMQALGGLTGELAHLSTEVGRLAARQVSSADFTELRSGQAVLQADVAELKSGQTVLQADVAELKSGQTALQADVAEVKSDMASVKTDVAELKTDMVTVKADVADLKTDMVIVKADVAELKTDMVTVKADVHRIDVKTDNLGDQLRLVAEGHGVLLAEIGRLREDCVAWARESHQFMLFVHKDLREYIDARLGGTGATG